MTLAWCESAAPPPHLPAAMQQHPAYGAACRRWGRSVTRLCLGPASAPTASVQVLHRRWPGLGRCAMLARGPVWHDPGCDRLGALTDLVARLRRTHAAVIVTPDAPDPLPEGARLLELMTSLHVAELDLTAPEPVRRARLKGKWRNRLTQAETAGLQVTETPLPPDPNHWLLRAEAAQARARRYRRLPPAFAAAWAAANPAGARLFTASRGDAPLAAILVLLHRPAASYHIAWSGAEGRRLSAPALLLWQATNWLSARGFTRFDLDSVDTEEGMGRARFKLGSGADVRVLGPTVIAAPGTGLVARLARGAAPCAGAARAKVC